MPAILSLETSTDVCSVALHNEGVVLAQAEINEPQSHASRLAPMIEGISAQAGISLNEICAVAISAGPGSYTGLRIGTSTAKGLCYALDIPLIAIGTLELLAFQGNRFNQGGDWLCPMIDARRMEVYCLVADQQLNIVEPVAARVIDGSSFAELLAAHRVLFFGNGAKKCREVIIHDNAIFLDDVNPSATALGVLANKKYQDRSFEDVIQFRPFYLKEFVAKKAGAGI